LRGFDYRAQGAYFVTIVTFSRACLLGAVVNDHVRLTTVGEAVQSGWLASDGNSPRVGHDLFVVMPNHIHGILVLAEAYRAKHPPQADTSPLHPSPPRGTAPGSISAIVQSFKAVTSRRIRSLPNMEGVRVWQRGFYDHIIRDDAELNRLRRYIEENPLRWAIDEENPASRKT
jgi:REP element-mobilizing transposase RayT